MLSLSHCTYMVQVASHLYLDIAAQQWVKNGCLCLPILSCCCQGRNWNLFHIQLQPPFSTSYGNRKSIVLISWTTGVSHTCCTFNLDANIFCIHVRCIRRIPHSLDWGEKLWTWFASCPTVEKNRRVPFMAAQFQWHFIHVVDRILSDFVSSSVKVIQPLEISWQSFRRQFQLSIISLCTITK